jgi:hypothetical protein
MLESAGASGNSRCGLHIHVDGNGMSNKVKRVVNEFKQFESVFYGLCGDKAIGRLNNRFCNQSRNWFSSARGRSLNTLNMNRTDSKKTFEFRLFGAELNSFYILTAVYACVALVEHVARTTKNSPDLSGMSLEQRHQVFLNRFWSNEDDLIIPTEPTKDIEMILEQRILESDIRLTSTDYIVPCGDSYRGF